MSDPIWISKVETPAATGDGPLNGMTFAVKDNMDVAGMPTTAACPAFAYTPHCTAPAVEALQKAGAVLVGKTNMDQFATGLVGTRTPYGACSSVFNDRYISGGSSSGSAVAVAKGLVTFALGTDTAGSGRVPAAFNGLIGLKPTRGVISTEGVVPACRSLDCVSIFARDCGTALKVLRSAQSRTATGAAPWLGGPFRFGVPAAAQLEFFGDNEAAELYQAFLGTLAARGGQRVEIDFSIFRAAAELLYSGPWVAERLAALGDFLKTHGEEMNPVVRGIIAGGAKYSAVDVFEAEYRLADLRRAAEGQWASMDVMVLPTTGTIYTHEAVAAEPIRLNTNLGYYTNFVNLMDLAAVAVPAGLRRNGLPFGISYIGPAYSDEALLGLADPELIPATPPGCVNVAVVGAHLSGQPLNWQLTTRGARLRKTCRTAPGYRLYALAGTEPLKPGLIRDEAMTDGPGIEVEVWAVPEERFGGFVAGVPAPLGIGNATLDDGTSVKSFICEPYAIPAATEITHLGSWRNYLRSR